MKSFNTILDTVKDTHQSKFYKHFKNHLKQRRLINNLIVLSTKDGITEQRMCEITGWTPHHLQKFESSKDKDLSLPDITIYVSAIITNKRETQGTT